MSVEAWLDSLPAPPSAGSTRLSKRARLTRPLLETSSGARRRQPPRHAKHTVLDRVDEDEGVEPAETWPAPLAATRSACGSLQPSEHDDSPPKPCPLLLLEYSPANPIREFATPNGHSNTTKPEEAKALLRRMRQIGRAQGVLAASTKESMQEVFDTDSAFGSNDFYTDQGASDLQGYEKDMSRIERATFECMDDNDAEAAWHCQVHSGVMQLALATCKHEGLQWKHISTADIEEAYAPHDLDDRALTSPCVDFAIVLRCTVPEVRTLEALLEPDSISVNHTEYPPLLRKPLAFSIKTALAGKTSATALREIGVWSFAHFARLRAMLGRTPPFLPHLLVDGSGWRLVLAWQAESDGRLGTFVWRQPEPLGYSSSASGVARIVAAVHELCAWAAGEHGAWLQDAATAVRA